MVSVAVGLSMIFRDRLNVGGLALKTSKLYTQLIECFTGGDRELGVGNQFCIHQLCIDGMCNFLCRFCVNLGMTR